MARAAVSRSLVKFLAIAALIAVGIRVTKGPGGGPGAPSEPAAGAKAEPRPSPGIHPGSPAPSPPAPPPRPDAALWTRWAGQPMAGILRGLEEAQPPPPSGTPKPLTAPPPPPPADASTSLWPVFSPAAEPVWPVADDFAAVGSGIVFSAERTPLACWSFASGAPGDATASSGLGSIPGGSRLLPADFDRDGDLDLFVGRRGDWPDSLLRRNGGDPAAYEDITEAAGLLEFLDLAAAAWVDYDRDGWLDLFVAQRPPAGTRDSLLRLHRNEGGQTFTEGASAAGLAVSGEVRDALWRDLDDDGYPDLLLSLAGSPGRLQAWRSREANAGGSGGSSRTFEDITEAAGLAGIPGGGPLAAADFNADGRDDLAVAADGILSLLSASPASPGTFLDRTGEAGLSGVPGPTALAAEDLDLDGWVDLVLTGGGASAPVTRAWANLGDLPSHELPGAAGLGSAGVIRTLRLLDPTGSGRPAWFIGGGRDWHSGWLPNRSPLVAERRRIVLRLRSPDPSNPHGLGARILLSHRDRNWIYRSRSLTVDEPEEILGLDEAVSVESIEVAWPDRGRGRTRFGSLAVDHRHDLGPGPGDRRSLPLPPPGPVR